MKKLWPVLFFIVLVRNGFLQKSNAIYSKEIEKADNKGALEIENKIATVYIAENSYYKTKIKRN